MIKIVFPFQYCSYLIYARVDGTELQQGQCAGECVCSFNLAPFTVSKIAVIFPLSFLYFPPSLLITPCVSQITSVDK